MPGFYQPTSWLQFFNNEIVTRLPVWLQHAYLASGLTTVFKKTVCCKVVEIRILLLQNEAYMTEDIYTSNVTVDEAGKDQLIESIRLREQRLAANVDELISRLHPAALAKKGLDVVKSGFIDNSGRVKVGRAALLGTAAAGVIALGIARMSR